MSTETGGPVGSGDLVLWRATVTVAVLPPHGIEGKLQ